MTQVTVVMPVYNGEKFIKQAIASVFAQDVDLKLVISDDCSNDQSLKIAFECQKIFDKMDIEIITSNKNQGAAACRNVAIEKVETKYIAFLDCDDIWEKGKLTEQLEVMEKTDCAVCCTARELMDTNGKLLNKKVTVHENISYKNLLRHNSIAFSSAMVKTKIAKQFPMKNSKAHEDYIFWLDVLKKHGSAVGINKSYLKYRISENSKSGNKVKSAKMHYKSLLAHGINPAKAAVLFVSYAVNGFIKHKI